MNAPLFDWNRVFRVSPEIVRRDIAGELLMVPVTGSLADLQKVYSANPVGAFIIRRMDGEHTLAMIRDELLETFDVTKDEAETDLREFIDLLTQNGFVSDS